jgi:O-methyltransferase
MTAPGHLDIDLHGRSADDKAVMRWKPASLGEVKANMASTNYPMRNIVFVEGDVTSVLKDHVPQKISLLRLDTDWYESTLTELQYLYPQLVPHGMLILDDHGHWLGVRKAAEAYFDQINEPILLSKVNYSTRLGIKLGHTNVSKS